MEIKIRKGGPLCGSLFQWNPGNGRWYFIHERNIETKGSNELIRNFYNSMLIGLVATVKGVYNRVQKKLIVEL